ncbi:hypothetical protein [Enterocloster citroniae]|uniref:Uncharacterized protein n=1 Tax=Enterocloster citroniae TaxID=358743 RepID=A0AA41FLI8_9FIRM|nr:hypothetical protein [Enterocloster citroniae]MBT9813727.1 hypothetical protein [Enterocloster citroniae]MCB7067210.1 hypothetical protein [Enterocloster citroniae]RGC13203.1 hypothetical protein DWZ14_03060 [Enterocloster citroniae]
MTRAERRRLERQNRKQPTYNLSRDQMQGMKQEATRDAAETAFLLMLGIPVLMFKDHFGQLIRREVDGKSREQRFVDYCLEFYRQFDKELYTLDDIRAVLKDECDIEIDMQ